MMLVNELHIPPNAMV